jgi:dihydrofolate synthase/folylpolyglutamate synthase
MDPLDYLYGLEKLGIKFGLGNITTLSESLGNPQNQYPSVIIAGTNGKGSVAAMVDEALRQSGRRVGRYTSPHLVNLEERFAIDGRPVAHTALVHTAALVMDHIERLRRDGGLDVSPTFFEMTTAMAFEIFRSARVDIAVIEVGLGGRFDATNIVTPIAAAITSIDLDHEALLGSTIEAIAFEKAGVIKAGIPVVVGETKPAAVGVIQGVCDKVGARLVPASAGVAVAYSLANGSAVLDLETPHALYKGVHLALAGRHQVQNAVVAVRLLEELATAGVYTDKFSTQKGLENVEWPGRLQILKMEPGRQLLLDVAHNPAGARTAADFLREWRPGGLPMVFGVMRDKDATGMLTTLLPHATHFIATEPRNARAMDREALAAMARAIEPSLHVEAWPDPMKALERAFNFSSTVAATGSIFLVGDLLKELHPPWTAAERGI